MPYTLIILGVVGAAMAFLATPVWRRLAAVLGVLDHPSGRKIHLYPTPYLGGMSVLTGMLVTLVVAPQWLPDLLFDLDLLAAFVVGACAICLLGLFDDIRPIPAAIKLVASIVVGVGMHRAGFRVGEVSAPGGGTVELGSRTMSLLFTVGWYVLIMNAINIIDGMDGLAAGICAISGLTLFVMTLLWGDVLASVIAVALVGACLGFLPHNLPPARIFLGDCGSLLLGFSLASVTILSQTKSTSLITLIVPLMAMGVPVVDITFALMRRLRSGQNPFHPDKRHLHHRLMDLGLPTGRILLIFYFITGYLGVLAFMLRGAPVELLALNLVLLGAGFLLLVDTLHTLRPKQ